MSPAAMPADNSISYREACRQAIRDVLSTEPRTFIMGEDIGRYGGCYAVTKGLLDEFGEDRVRDTPLSESAFVGAGIGAALAGMRPIVRGCSSAPGTARSRRFDAAEKPRRAGFDATEMRKAIAAAMGRSKREIPHYYLGHTVDLGTALAWLETFNGAQPVPKRLLPAVLLLKASALALREVPRLNGTYVDGAFQPGAGIHVGWAISMRRRAGGAGDPRRRSAIALAIDDRMRDLVQRARSGGLRSSELNSPTVIATSLGERGAETVMGIIYPPQVAIIGFGSISTRLWVADGRVEARPLVTVSLAADHRTSDGHVGALLLNAIEQLLQEPDKL
jgi:pyruvate dehydrogenase E2 component (dihydrolipoamide acetyltransferase)